MKRKIPKWCDYLKPINVLATAFTAAALIVNMWINILDKDMIAKILSSYVIFMTASYIVYKIYVPSPEHLKLYESEIDEIEK